jgi:hypothetical protein
VWDDKMGKKIFVDISKEWKEKPPTLEKLKQMHKEKVELIKQLHTPPHVPNHITIDLQQFKTIVKSQEIKIGSPAWWSLAVKLNPVTMMALKTKKGKIFKVPKGTKKVKVINAYNPPDGWKDCEVYSPVFSVEELDVPEGEDTIHWTHSKNANWNTVDGSDYFTLTPSDMADFIADMENEGQYGFKPTPTFKSISELSDELQEKFTNAKEEKQRQLKIARKRVKPKNYHYPPLVKIDTKAKEKKADTDLRNLTNLIGDIEI